jgi:hypothetical protein
MDQIKDVAGKATEFAKSHPKAIAGIGTAVGAAVGLGIATSKIGIFVAATLGVVFAVSAGAVAGRMIGEVISRQHVEYIPPQQA